MKLLHVIDTHLLRAYQAVVNLSQRKREWWVEQCAYLMVVLFVLRWGTGDKGWVDTISFIGCVVYAVTTFYEARVSVYFERLRMAAGFRRYLLGFFLVCWVLDFVVLILAPEEMGTGTLLLSWLGRIAFLSPSYFAACEPPAPPRRRAEKKLEFAA